MTRAHPFFFLEPKRDMKREEGNKHLGDLLGRFTFPELVKIYKEIDDASVNAIRAYDRKYGYAQTLDDFDRLQEVEKSYRSKVRKKYGLTEGEADRIDFVGGLRHWPQDND